MAEAARRIPRLQHRVMAVFDLDGTLTWEDTLLPFLLQLAGPLRFALGMPLLILAMYGLGLRLISRQRAKEIVLGHFLRGRPLAEVTASAEHFSLERLPRMMRPAALERLQWHQSRGHRCVLISASPALYIEPWARNAGFEEVLATRLATRPDGRLSGHIDGLNCHGPEKLRRLMERYPDLALLELHGYGDSRSDGPLLGHCEHAHYQPFRGRDEASSAASGLRDLLRLMRPHQWVKNSFVLVGVIFGHTWLDPEYLVPALLGLGAFCLASSAVYVFNDLVDRESDRLHPKKRHRPLASGRVTTPAALALGAMLLLGAAGLGLSANLAVFSIVMLYMLMNLAYSLGLKSIVILDVFVIAAGFMLRILAGTLAIGIVPSHWLMMCGLMLTLFLGFTKRRAELLTVTIAGRAPGHRAVLLHYSPALLDKLISISAGGAVMAYSLYSMSEETARLHDTRNLVYTVPFVLYGIFRYLYLLHAQRAGTDTSSDLASDKHLIAAVAGWLLLTVWLIY